MTKEGDDKQTMRGKIIYYPVTDVKDLKFQKNKKGNFFIHSFTKV